MLSLVYGSFFVALTSIFFPTCSYSYVVDERVKHFEGKVM